MTINNQRRNARRRLQADGSQLSLPYRRAESQRKRIEIRLDDEAIGNRISLPATK